MKRIKAEPESSVASPGDELTMKKSKIEPQTSQVVCEVIASPGNQLQGIKTEPQTSKVVCGVIASSRNQQTTHTILPSSKVVSQVIASPGIQQTTPRAKKAPQTSMVVSEVITPSGSKTYQVLPQTIPSRQRSAVQDFALKSSKDNNLLYKQILGTHLEDLCESNDSKPQSASSLPTLSAEQEKAVNIATQNRLTLIQGTAGSGKTVTLLSILYNLVQQNKGPILVCAPTNAVVDQLALKIHEMKLKVVRLFAELNPSEGAPTYFLGLESQIRKNLPPGLIKLEKSCDDGQGSSGDEEEFDDTSDERRMMAERTILDGADVICCTIVSAGDERLSCMKFQSVLIDDSMQATEPECTIPIVLGCERLVLVGDPLQLSPIIKCPRAVEGGLKQTLLERLVSAGVKPLLLLVQYRMHPSLWYLPSCHYLERSLPSLSGVSAEQRKLPDQALVWPNADFPLVIYDIKGRETRMIDNSYINDAEAAKIEQLVTNMLERGISPDRIGIITQYEAQKNYVMQHMERCGRLEANKYRAVEVNKVDAFQGREKDIIIISCVRSPGRTGLGSLGYKERFHLVFTRAKFGLIIVANSTALLKSEQWKNLLDFCKLHKVWIKKR